MRQPIRLLAAVLTGLMIFTSAAYAEINLADSRVITIKGVYLKNAAGAWVKIIEPDRRVDLSKEEPEITFFNNTGRVPSSAYKNFRIDFTSEDSSSPKRVSSKDDFEKNVTVKKGSFIHVSFDLAAGEKSLIQKANMTVDEDSRQFSSDLLTLEV